MTAGSALQAVTAHSSNNEIRIECSLSSLATRKVGEQRIARRQVVARSGEGNLCVPELYLWALTNITAAVLAIAS